MKKIILINENFSEGNIVHHGSAKLFDNFDENFIGSGHENKVHGHGFYFSFNKDIAKFYGKELKKIHKKAFVYTVKLYSYLNFLDWERTLSKNESQEIIDCYIEEYGDEDAEEMADALGLSDSYWGDFISAESIYSHLRAVLGNDKNASEFLSNCGFDGIIFNSKENGFNEKNVVIFSPDSIYKIIEVEKV